MIYTSARYANADHTQVTGTDADGNTETVPANYTIFRCPDDGPIGFVNNGGVIADYAKFEGLAEAMAAKLAELDDFRWQVEIGGTEMAGITIRTDPNSQAKVAAAYTMARLDPAYEVPTWEALPGLFVPLSNAQLIAMGEAVRDHVQDTFNRKAVLHAAITALESVEAVEAFDIETEWGNDDR